jgi:hypothetical protein
MMAIAGLLAVLFGIPLCMYALMRLARQYKGRFRNAVGNALEDLDRNTTRPSVEHKIAHETSVVYEEDERGGE